MFGSTGYTIRNAINSRIVGQLRNVGARAQRDTVAVAVRLLLAAAAAAAADDDDDDDNDAGHDDDDDGRHPSICSIPSYNLKHYC